MNPFPPHTTTSKMPSPMIIFLQAYSLHPFLHGSPLPLCMPTKNWVLSNSTIRPTPPKSFVLFKLQSYYLCHKFLPQSLRHQQLTTLTSLLIPAPPSNASAASLLALTTMAAMTSSQTTKPAFSMLSIMATTSTNPFSPNSHLTSSCPLVGAGAVTSAPPYSSPLTANATISPHAPISPPHSQNPPLNLTKILGTNSTFSALCQDTANLTPFSLLHLMPTHKPFLHKSPHGY